MCLYEGCGRSSEDDDSTMCSCIVVKCDACNGTSKVKNRFSVFYFNLFN